MNTSINYVSLASRLNTYGPLAARFLRLHLRSRKNGVRKTTARTIGAKLKADNAPVTKEQAVSLLHFYSEIGLGTVGLEYGHQYFMRWNQAVCLKTLVSFLEPRSAQTIVPSPQVQVNPSPTVICRLPVASQAVLINSGLACLLGMQFSQPRN